MLHLSKELEKFYKVPLIQKMDREVRSVFSLNRKKEYQTLVDFLELKESDRLLDVGCGDGYWTNQLAQISKHAPSFINTCIGNN